MSSLAESLEGPQPSAFSLRLKFILSACLAGSRRAGM